MGALPDGYERWPDAIRGPGLRLIDPTDCPTGHPFRWGQRGSLAYCGEHKPHNTWWCACGQKIYRVEGAFVDELECVSSRA
jgi:hypothetical protein